MCRNFLLTAQLLGLQHTQRRQITDTRCKTETAERALHSPLTRRTSPSAPKHFARLFWLHLFVQTLPDKHPRSRTRRPSRSQSQRVQVFRRLVSRRFSEHHSGNNIARSLPLYNPRRRFFFFVFFHLHAREAIHWDSSVHWDSPVSPAAVIDCPSPNPAELLPSRSLTPPFPPHLQSPFLFFVYIET